MKNNKGISLIVLIITIVVIIILAAAIILNLKDTNIIENSNEAVVKQDFKTFESELDLYIADEFVDTKGKLDVTTIDATTKEEVAAIIPSIQGSKYEEYVTIVDGKMVVSDEMPEEQKEWANESLGIVPLPKTPDGEEIVFDNTEGTANATINGGAFAYNNPVVPVGFMAINTPDANWNDANGWNNGLVIEDGSGNEFVWVPCTLDGTNGTIKYAKNLDYPKNSRITSVSDDTDALPAVNSRTIDQTVQISKYGGFYIGRYEACVPANQTAIDGASKETSDKEGIPVVKKDSIVWTYISYANANTNALAICNTDNVKSGLLTGTAWDTVCAWIQSEIDSERNILHSVTDSTSWGNYYTDPVDGDNGKQLSGYSESWKAKNIYDLAGNMYEWTGEIYASYYIYRGGCYNMNGSFYPAAYRFYYSNPMYVDSSGMSFRILLYVM